MFERHQKIRHVKTGKVYVILTTPIEGSYLEYCNETYYTYVGGIPRTMWLRRTSEMEDGRFVTT